MKRNGDKVKLLYKARSNSKGQEGLISSAKHILEHNNADQIRSVTMAAARF